MKRIALSTKYKVVRRNRKFCALFILMLFVFSLEAQNVGLGTSSPSASAKLDIQSTNSGLLVPRMNSSQRNGIASPANGLFVYDTDSLGFMYFNGTVWTKLKTQFTESDATAWKKTGNSGTNSSVNFLGTTDNHPMKFRVNNLPAGLIDSSGGKNNTAMGYRTFSNLTNGTNNTAMGDSALLSSTTASYNTAVGSKALMKNLSGNENTAVGLWSLMNNTGSYNTAMGKKSLGSNTSGSYNTALGLNAMESNLTGISNTAVGLQSLQFLTSSNENTAVGNNSLEYTTGPYNTAIGFQAMQANTTGSNNTGIGYKVNLGSSGLTNATAIGSNARVDASNSLVLGGITGVNGGVSVNVGIGTTTPSERLDVIGKTKTTNFQMTSGASNGYVLTSDASGNATWQASSGGSISGSGAATRVAFWDGTSSLSSNSNLYWDNTNSRLGIGTASPTLAKLQVQGVVGNTAALFSQSANSMGVSIISDWPGIFFNSYYDGGHRQMSSGGFASAIGTDQVVGGMTFVTSPVANSSAGSIIPGSNEVMRLTAGAKVGIGTISPNAKLDVSGCTETDSLRMPTGATAGYVLTSDASGNATWQAPAGGGGSISGSGAATRVAFWNGASSLSSNSNLYWDNTNSRLGIGTSSPIRPIEIASGQLRFTNALGDLEFTECADLVTNVTTASPAANTPVLRVNSNSTLSNTLLFMQHDGKAGFGNSTPQNRVDVEGGLGVGTNYAGSSAAPTNGAIIEGSVGIGTNNPSLAKLQVTGMAGNTSGIFQGSANSQGLALVSDWPGLYYNCYYNGGFKQMASSGYASIINGNMVDGGIAIVTSATANTSAGATLSTLVERVTVLGNGNVGIGNITPSALLDVNGTTKLGTNGTALTEVIKSTVNKDVASIAAGSSGVETFTVSNAIIGSTVSISPANALADGLVISYARVSATNTVEVKFYNATGSPIDPAVMNFYITVIR